MFTPVTAPPRIEALDNFTLSEGGPAPSARQVEALIDLLASAERPVVIAGGGATLSRSAEALLAFAEATGIPVTTGMKGEGLMPQDHPLYGGSMVSVPIAAAIGAPADLVLLLGQRVGLFTGGRYGVLPAGAKVAQVDIDGGEPGRGGPIDLAIMADCRETLLALTEAAKGRNWPDRPEWAGALKTARMIPHQQWLEAPATSPAGLLHPYHACKALAEALPEDAIIVCDGGESSVWVRDHIRPKGTGSFHITGYLGTLGVGQGFAIGAARAFPDRPVFLFAGDGGVGFHIQEFDAMVRHGLNVHTIVLNNACWGMSQNGQDLIYGQDKRAIVELADSAYEKVAEAFGGKAYRADTIDEITAAMKAAIAGGVPSCINVRIDGTVINPVTMNMVGIKPGEKPKAKSSDSGTAKSEGEKVVMPYYENVE